MKIVSALFLFILASSSAFAQALPFVKRPVTQGELAQAIEVGNMSILNLSPNDFVRAVNTAFGLELKTPEDLAGYIRRLTRTPCPVDRDATLGRVLKGGEVDLYGFKREFREGEECLLDNNTGHYVVSLMCGNVVTSTDLPIFGLVASEDHQKSGVDEKAHISGPPEVSFLPSSPRTPKQSQSWFSRHKKWFLPVAGAVAGGVTACAISGCFKNTQTVTVTIR